MAVHNPDGFHFPEKKKHTRTSINLHENRKKQTNNKTGNLYIAFSCTFDVSPLRKFALTHLPNAWFPLIFMGFMYSPLINFNFHKKPDDNFETIF